MRELRLHRTVYSENAIAEAIGVFADYATIDQSVSDQHFVVRISSESATRERKIAGELGNYALGVSVRDLGER